MGAMPSRIAKGPIFECIDGGSKDHDWACRIHKALKHQHKKSLTDIAVEYGCMSDAEKQLLDQTWFSSWWKTIQPVEPTFREALCKAAELCCDLAIPVEVYWVCTPTVHFEVAVCLSDQQVTVVVSTPLPEASPPCTEDEPIVVFRKTDASGNCKKREYGPTSEGVYGIRLRTNARM